MAKNIIIVTGASSGIGRLLAKQVSEEYPADEVWAIARSEEKLNALQSEIKTPVRAIPLDLGKAESGERLRALLEAERPAVRVLINAAGYGIFERFDRISETDNLGMIDLNCRALTQITCLCLPYLTAGSKVLNVASVAAFQPLPYINVYAATKAYVLSFSRALARELKPRGVRVLALCPYWTKTAFFDRSNQQSVITRFDCMYDPAFIVKKAMKALKGKRDYVVPGAIAKATHALTKVLPHKLVMSVFMRQQKLHKK